jgi:Tol biopolymer transport system component/DNA-binding winged helix-turn-helix (wHTH) protein
MTYYFGPYSINDDDRLLLREGVIVPLTPKVADLLLLLLSRPGHVFDKNQMLAALWSGAFVEEANIAQNISQLRKTLGDPAEKPIYIETIPRRGYRWIAPLCEPSPRAAPTPKWSFPSSRALIAGAAAVLLALIGVLWIRGGSRAPAPVLRPFTSYRGGEYAPAFSRDGQRVAFVWRPESQRYFDVFIKSIESEELTRVTNGEFEHGSVSWSPKGDSLAFLRYGKGDYSAVVKRSLMTGEERIATRAFTLNQIHDRHVDWSPVNDDLAIADKSGADEPFAIYIVSAATGQRRRLTRPPPGSRGDTGAVFSRDGQRIAFRRTLGATVTDLYVVPVAGGEPRRITFDIAYTSAHDWTSDDSEIVFSSSREGGFALWRVSESGGEPKPAWPTGGNFLSIAGSRLAFSLWFADTNIWRLPIGPGHSGTTAPLIASTRTDISPHYSPDGNSIAFRSNRSGTDEIWIANSDGSSERPVTHFAGPLTGSPRWSPDSWQIAFDSRPGGEANIFVISGAGGAPRQVTGGGNNVVPSWSGDGRWIYYSSNRTGNWQVWRIPADSVGGSGAIQITQHGGFAPFESHDGRFVYYAKGENVPGIWRVPVPGGSEEEFCAQPLGGLWGHWALGPKGLYIVDTDKISARLIRVSYQTRSPTQVRELPRPPFWNDGGLALAPDERWILYAQADSDGSDIFVVDGFR